MNAGKMKGMLEGSAAQDRMLLVLAAIGFLFILRFVYLLVLWFYSYFLRPAKNLQRSLSFLLRLVGVMQTALFSCVPIVDNFFSAHLVNTQFQCIEVDAISYCRVSPF